MAQSSPARPTAASQLADDGFEQGLLGQRARRDEADDRAIDQRLGPARLAGLGGAFGLLRDGDAMAAADQPREVGFGRVDRYPAHRDRLALRFPALGQRDVEAGGGGLGVVEEQFEEVAHAVEQQCVTSFGLEPLVLLHHRCGCVRARHNQAVAARFEPCDSTMGERVTLPAAVR